MKKSLLYPLKIFSFTTSTQTIYKRPLPPFLIQLNSEQGKFIFKEALMSGEMECFFPLIEQFTTQCRPSTCGTTTLTMVLNALGIDPKRTWQGIWRWYSEESLLCSHPDYLKEINIEQFAHLAKRNKASIHFFYHLAFNIVKNHSHKEINVEKYDKNDVKALEKLKDETEESLLYLLERSTMSCPAGCTTPTSLVNKSASFETFEDCVMATSRRDGFFLTCNSSRKALNQTGEGHFSPIGGYHFLKKLVLVLDVARYKYPPYWCNIKTLYDSLEPIDKATNKPRGFCLITKSYINYASICRVSKDFKSLEGVKKWRKSLKVEELNVGNLAVVIEKMLADICDDFRYLFVFYLFELGNRIDPDQILHSDKLSSEEQKFGQNHLNSLVNSFKCSTTKLIIHEILDIFESGNKKNRIIKLIQDFHPYLQEELISIILMSLADIISYNNAHLKDFCDLLRKDITNSWNNAFEVDLLKKELGIISENGGLDAFKLSKNI